MKGWNGTGADLPTPSPEPKITYDNDFQAQTLVDNEECTIILQSVGYDDVDMAIIGSFTQE